MRIKIHNLRTGGGYEFRAASQAEVDAKLASEPSYGRPERREPSASRDGDPCQWRIEDVAGELVLVHAATITAVETRTPLREARPDWYACGVPRLDGAEVVIPPEYAIETIDTTAEDAARAADLAERAECRKILRDLDLSTISDKPTRRAIRAIRVVLMRDMLRETP